MGKGKPFKSAEKEYGEYREWLLSVGYAPVTSSRYCRGIKMFEDEGHSLDDDTKAWRDELLKRGMTRKNANDCAQGVKRYRTYLDGGVFVNRYNKFKCDDDCFNCKYEDCLKPDYLCHSTEVKDGLCDS